MSDLLWSDPEDNLKEWNVNPRGAGHLFGNTVVESVRTTISNSLYTPTT